MAIFLPCVLADQATQIEIKLNTTEFLGWEDDNKTVPRMRAHTVEHSDIIGSGELLLLGRTLMQGEGESRAPKLLIYCFSTTLINSRGEPLAARGR